MFKNVKIRNLRAITDLNIDNLGQVNLFVGKNNCGKTTVLEAIFFLIGSTNPHLPVKANSLRGLHVFNSDIWPTFFHNMDIEIPIEIEGEVYETIDVTKEIMKLLIRPKKEESHESQNMSSDITSFEIKTSESMPSFVPNGLKLEYKNSINANEVFHSSIFEKDNKITTEGTKESGIQGFYISPSISTDLKDRFGSIQRKKRLEKVVGFLKQIDPKIVSLSLNEVGIIEADIGLSELIPINLMGGVIVKILSIVLSILDFENGIVLIDEIENGLHYSAQHTIWKALFSLSQEFNVQVFVTTHSMECIAAFCDYTGDSLFTTEAKLFRIEKSNEKFRSVEYDKAVLSESLDSNWEIR